MKTAAILQGWAGGRWHTQKFAKELLTQDIQLTPDKIGADIIIAHSVGCYDIPKTTSAEVIMLIDPPYWPDRSIVSRLIKKEGADTKSVRANYGTAYFLKKKFWEGVYIFIKPSYTLLALKDMDISGLLTHLGDKSVILVRNKSDYFCTPQIAVELKSYKNVRYKELPGEHDDYYTNPQPYIDLLLKELK